MLRRGCSEVGVSGPIDDARRERPGAAVLDQAGAGAWDGIVWGCGQPAAADCYRTSTTGSEIGVLFSSFRHELGTTLGCVMTHECRLG